MSAQVREPKILSAEELARSLQPRSRWDRRSPVWVFGYSSLIWNPGELVAALLRGFTDTTAPVPVGINRGTPERRASSPGSTAGDRAPASSIACAAVRCAPSSSACGSARC
jgi:cation transport protein ChaC